ncbi:hypothetical protein EOPP23_19500 [Endozoicomonas sp. OPT23]|uniref:hypothetical protein n=1 Tax=Endozoicomonas sp. OPT23 TaxID=2072845 RepID=UPI00129BFEA4|nr:hypothetical protein [Endozoicomonas sp. OPT23]MRI35156.1 hypothetical protein [Endozoicomonas sp. OPT23]
MESAMYSRLLLIAAICLHVPLTSAVTIKDQLILEQQAYKVASSFYYISLDEGNSEAYEELETVLTEMDGKLAGVRSEEQAKLNEVRSAWKALKGFSRKNEMKEEGYTSHYATVDVNTSRANMVKALRGDDRSIKSPALDVEALELAAEMQRLEMYYTEGAVSLLGFPYDKLDVDAKAFGERVRKFEQRIKRESPETGKTAAEIVRAWVYIEKALINFHEINVPELVKRMNKVIVSKLVEISKA